MLAHQPQLGLPDAAADTIAQILMYAQFPLYGFLLASSGAPPASSAPPPTVVLIHGLAVAAVMILAQL